MELSEFVKVQRKKAGLTQPQLAHKAGVGLRFLREVEQGGTSFRLDKLNQLLRMFGYEMGPVPMDRSKWIS